MKYGRLSLLTLLICTAPLVTLAAIPAGLPTTPLWLSQNVIADGDTVSIFTVLYNQSDVNVRGAVEFSVDSVSISSSPFDLAPGKSEIVSAPWHAVTGEHVLATALHGATDSKNNAVTLAGTDASMHITVLPPPRTEAQKNLDAASSTINSLLGSSSPALAQAATNAFALTEAVRESAAQYLESKLTSSTPARKGSVLGVSTSRQDTPTPASWWQSGLQWLYRGLLIIVRSVALFYPVVAALFFFLFYLLIKTVRRPRS